MHKGLAPPQKLKQFLQAGKEKDPKEPYGETTKQSQQLTATNKASPFSLLSLRDLSPCVVPAVLPSHTYKQNQHVKVAEN